MMLAKLSAITRKTHKPHHSRVLHIWSVNQETTRRTYSRDRRRFSLQPQQQQKHQRQQQQQQQKQDDKQQKNLNSLQSHETRKAMVKNLGTGTKMPISKKDEDKLLKFMRYAHEGKQEELKKSGYAYDERIDGYYKTYVSEGLRKMEEESDMFDNDQEIDESDDEEDIFSIPEISKEAPISLEDVLSQAEIILKNMNTKQSQDKFDSDMKAPNPDVWRQQILPFEEETETKAPTSLLDSPYFDEILERNNNKKTDNVEDLYEEDEEENLEADEDEYDPSVRYVQFMVSEEAIAALESFEYETRASLDLNPKRARTTTREKNQLIDLCLFAFDDGAKQEEQLEKKLQLAHLQRLMTLEDLTVTQALRKLRESRVLADSEGSEYLELAGEADVIVKEGDVTYTFGYHETKKRIYRVPVVEKETRTVKSLLQSNVGDHAEKVQQEMLEYNQEMVEQEWEDVRKSTDEERKKILIEKASQIHPQDVPYLMQKLQNLAKSLGYEQELHNMKQHYPGEWTSFIREAQEKIMLDKVDSDVEKALMLFGVDPDEMMREYMTETARFHHEEDLRKRFPEEFAKGATVEDFETTLLEAHQDPQYSQFSTQQEQHLTQMIESIRGIAQLLPKNERKDLGLGDDLSHDAIFRAMIKTSIKSDQMKQVRTHEEMTDIMKALEDFTRLDLSKMPEEEAQETMRNLTSKLNINNKKP